MNYHYIQGRKRIIPIFSDKIERKCIVYIIDKSRLTAYGRFFGSLVWFLYCINRFMFLFFHAHELIWDKEEVWCANASVEVT